MNWKDELEDEKGYTICPICFPEYVYCDEGFYRHWKL